MTTHQLRQQLSHRPWELPDRPWQFYQEWNNCIFLHWPVSMADLRPWVPGALEIDQWEGTAWVSVVAFRMERIRLRYLPSFPPVSNFGELNIRTYVKFGGKAGVYFLSIEGSKRLSCWIARTASELPYRYAAMQQGAGYFRSVNAVEGDTFAVSYELGQEISTKSAPDRWLTERYGLFQDGAAGINAFDIHHPEWPLRTLTIAELQLDYRRFAELLPGKPELTHYSTGVPVLAWSREKHAGAAPK